MSLFGTKMTQTFIQSSQNQEVTFRIKHKNTNLEQNTKLDQFSKLVTKEINISEFIEL
ncbi:unnamed protein product [Paramecium octaurelia]|uniref:Uncharacterized protein n=1 Tax=Paramecium octaurelia TaxID=43137 RepID=A0A8S1YQG7_PAROT|nr:unnamed protein product [Paramecium octaurelia]